jgi:hypothetical protein
MFKLLDILLEDENILIPRRSKEERSKNHLIAVQKQIQQYIKDGSKGSLDLSNTPIESLPDNLTVGGYLDLRDTPIQSLPKNLNVENSLDLTDTLIKSLPNDLKVGGGLFIEYTPLSKKYTKEEIKKMVPNVKGFIYI